VSRKRVRSEDNEIDRANKSGGWVERREKVGGVG
jgi:hypothetical protein